MLSQFGADEDHVDPGGVAICRLDFLAMELMCNVLYFLPSVLTPYGQLRKFLLCSIEISSHKSRSLMTFDKEF